MKSREVINRICLYLLGAWVFATLAVITEKAYNEKIPTIISVIMGVIWFVYVLTISVKEE